MTDNQELMRELAKLGYESYIKDEVVVIVISPADFICGHKLLKADLERLGWNRTYSYTPSRPLTPEEQAEWDRYTDPFPELRDAANRQRGAANKQQHPSKCNRDAAQKQQHPAQSRSRSAAYKARLGEADSKDKKKVGSGTLPESSDEIPGQMNIFQFLGGEV